MQTAAKQPRAITCERCGTAFECGLSGNCWCADEAFRMPLPTDTGDCLCPACLRKAAETAGAAPLRK